MKKQKVDFGRRDRFGCSAGATTCEYSLIAALLAVALLAGAQLLQLHIASPFQIAAIELGGQTEGTITAPSGTSYDGEVQSPGGH